MSPPNRTETNLTEPRPGGARRNLRVAAICAVVLAAMTGAAYASVPLYRAFCQATGFAGTVSRANSAPKTVLERTLLVRFDTNVRGVFFSLKHELRVMTAQGFGSIVNLSSTFGERGGAGAALYSASKHAVNGFTRSAALEVAARGIRVNAVAPGPVATGGLDRFTGGSEEAAAAMAAGVPAGRLGHVDDIADVITFLASDHARFVTGQVVAVNGGKTAA